MSEEVHYCTDFASKSRKDFAEGTSAAASLLTIIVSETRALMVQTSANYESRLLFFSRPTSFQLSLFWLRNVRINLLPDRCRVRLILSKIRK